MTARSVVYTGEGAREFPGEEVAAVEAEGTTWVRATGATPEELRAVADELGIHELAVEDVVNNVRPKVEEFEGYTFVLVKTARLRRGETSFEEEIRDDPVGVFFGAGWVATLSTAEVEAVDRVWDRVARGERRLLVRDADFTAYRVLDVVVDDYFGLVDEVEDDIERVEDDVMATPDITTLERINDLRRELLSIRRLLWPTRDAVGVLARGDVEGIAEANEKYFRDVYDHLVQLVDLTETYRDLTAGARDIYLNRLSQSTNEVMKTLTVVATIVLPLTFVVGVYGMNFSEGAANMPELTWDYAYLAVMLGMAGIAGVMLAYFRRQGWL